MYAHKGEQNMISLLEANELLFWFAQTTPHEQLSAILSSVNSDEKISLEELLNELSLIKKQRRTKHD